MLNTFCITVFLKIEDCGGREGFLILHVGLSSIWVHMLLCRGTLRLHWLRSAPSANRSCVLHWYIQALREYIWSPEPSSVKDKNAWSSLIYIHSVVLKYSQYYVTCTLRILMPLKAIFTILSICCVFSCTAVPSNTQWCIHCACSCLVCVCVADGRECDRALTGGSPKDDYSDPLWHFSELLWYI
jgi:hypothetical protein